MANSWVGFGGGAERMLGRTKRWSCQPEAEEVECVGGDVTATNHVAGCRLIEMG